MRAESNDLRGLINGKQNILTQGTHTHIYTYMNIHTYMYIIYIIISGSKISGFDGNYNSLTNKFSAGTGISIDGNTNIRLI